MFANQLNYNDTHLAWKQRVGKELKGKQNYAAKTYGLLDSRTLGEIQAKQNDLEAGS